MVHLTFLGSERSAKCVAVDAYADVRRYWPALPDGALEPDYAGVRPKLHAPGGAARDFLLLSEREHGVRGLVSLFGIESTDLPVCCDKCDCPVCNGATTNCARGGPVCCGDAAPPRACPRA